MVSSRLIRLDGITVTVDRLTDSACTGQSVLMSELSPIDQRHGLGTAAALQEAAANGWPEQALIRLAEWHNLPLNERSLEQAARSGSRPGERYEFRKDDRLLTPPYPIDLLFVGFDARNTVYPGISGSRPWLTNLRNRAVDTSSPLEVFGVTMTQETWKSATGVSSLDFAPTTRPSWFPIFRARVLVGGEALQVQCHYKSHTETGMPLGASQELTYLVPAEAVSEITVHAEWSGIKPWLGPGKTYFIEHGYGPLDSMKLALTYNDGWRTCKLAVECCPPHSYASGREEIAINTASTILNWASSRSSEGSKIGGISLRPDRPSDGNTSKIPVTQTIQTSHPALFGIAVDLEDIEVVDANSVDLTTPRPSPPSGPPTAALVTAGRTAIPALEENQDKEMSLATEVGLLAAEGVMKLVAWLAPLVVLVMMGLLTFNSNNGLGLGFILLALSVFLLRNRMAKVVANYQGSKMASENQYGVNQVGFVVGTIRETFWLIVGGFIGFVGLMMVLSGMF